MKTGKSIIWGLCLVIVGVLLCLNVLEVINFDIFFDGWWTLFIIIPSITNLVTDDNKTASIIFLIIGIENILLFIIGEK